MKTAFKKSLLLSVLLTTSTAAGVAYIAQQYSPEETASDFSYTHSYKTEFEHENEFKIKHELSFEEKEQAKIDMQNTSAQLEENANVFTRTTTTNPDYGRPDLPDEPGAGGVWGLTLSDDLQNFVNSINTSLDGIGINSDGTAQVGSIWGTDISTGLGSDMSVINDIPTSPMGVAIQGLNDIVAPFFNEIGWDPNSKLNGDTTTTASWYLPRMIFDTDETGTLVFTQFWNDLFTNLGLSGPHTTKTEIISALETHITDISNPLHISSSTPSSIDIGHLEHVDTLTTEQIAYIVDMLSGLSYEDVVLPTLTAPQIPVGSDGNALSQISFKLDNVTLNMYTILGGFQFFGVPLFVDADGNGVNDYVPDTVKNKIISSVQNTLNTAIDTALSDFPTIADKFKTEAWAEIEADVTTFATNIETGINTAQESVDNIQADINEVNAAIDEINAYVAQANTIIGDVNDPTSDPTDGTITSINDFVETMNLELVVATGKINDAITAFNDGVGVSLDEIESILTDDINGLINTINGSLDEINVLIDLAETTVNALITSTFGKLDEYVAYTNATLDMTSADLIYLEAYVPAWVYVTLYLNSDAGSSLVDHGNNLLPYINSYEEMIPTETIDVDGAPITINGDHPFKEVSITPEGGAAISITDPVNPTLVETTTDTYALTYEIYVREGVDVPEYNTDAIGIYEEDGTPITDITFSEPTKVESGTMGGEASSNTMDWGIFGSYTFTTDHSADYDLNKYEVTIGGLTAGKNYNLYMSPNVIEDVAGLETATFGNAINVNLTPSIHYMPNEIFNVKSEVGLIDATATFDIYDGVTAWDITQDDVVIETVLASDGTTAVEGEEITTWDETTDKDKGITHVSVNLGNGLTPETDYTTTVYVRSTDLNTNGEVDAGDYVNKYQTTWTAGVWPLPTPPTINGVVKPLSVTKHEASILYEVSNTIGDPALGENQAVIEEVELYQKDAEGNLSETPVLEDTGIHSENALTVGQFDLTGLTLNTEYNYVLKVIYSAKNGSDYVGLTDEVLSSDISFTTIDKDPAVEPKDLSLTVDETKTTTDQMVLNFSFTDPATPVDTINTVLKTPEFYYQEETAAFAAIPTSNIIVKYDGVGVTGPVADDNAADVVYSGTATVTGLTPNTNYSFRMDIDSNYWVDATIENPEADSTIVSTDGSATDKTLKLDVQEPTFTDNGTGNFLDGDAYYDGLKYLSHTNGSISVGYSFELPTNDLVHKNTIFKGLNVYSDQNTTDGSLALLTKDTDYVLTETETGTIDSNGNYNGKYSGTIDFIGLDPSATYKFKIGIDWASYDDDLIPAEVAMPEELSSEQSASTLKAPAIEAHFDETDGFEFVSQEIIDSTRVSDVGEKVQATYSYHFWLPEDNEINYGTELLDSTDIYKSLVISAEKIGTDGSTYEPVTLTAGTDFIITPTAEGDVVAGTGRNYTGTILFTDLNPDSTYKFTATLKTVSEDPDLVDKNLPDLIETSEPLATDLYAAKQGYFGTLANPNDGFEQVGDSTDTTATFKYNFTIPSDVVGYYETDFVSFAVYGGTTSGSLSTLTESADSVTGDYILTPSKTFDPTTGTGVAEGEVQFINLTQATTYFFQIGITTNLGEVLSPELSATTILTAAKEPTIDSFAFDTTATTFDTLTANFKFTLPATETGYESTDFTGLNVYGGTTTAPTTLLVEGTDYNITWKDGSAPATQGTFEGTLTFGTTGLTALNWATTYYVSIELLTTYAGDAPTMEANETTSDHPAKAPTFNSFETVGKTDESVSTTFSITIPDHEDGYIDTVFSGIEVQMCTGTDESALATVTTGYTLAWDSGSAPATSGTFTGTVDFTGLTRFTDYVFMLGVETNYTDTIYSEPLKVTTDTTAPIAPYFGTETGDDGLIVNATTPVTDTSFATDFEFTLPATETGFQDTTFKSLNVYTSEGDKTPIDTAATSTLTYDVAYDGAEPGVDVPVVDGATYKGTITFSGLTANTIYNIKLGLTSSHVDEVFSNELTVSTDLAPKTQIAKPTYVLDASKTTQTTLTADFSFEIPDTSALGQYQTNVTKMEVVGGLDESSSSVLTEGTDYDVTWTSSKPALNTTVAGVYEGSITLKGLSAATTYYSVINVYTDVDVLTPVTSDALVDATTNDRDSKDAYFGTDGVDDGLSLVSIDQTEATLAFDFTIPEDEVGYETTTYVDSSLKFEIKETTATDFAEATSATPTFGVTGAPTSASHGDFDGTVVYDGLFEGISYDFRVSFQYTTLVGGVEQTNTAYSAVVTETTHKKDPLEPTIDTFEQSDTEYLDQIDVNYAFTLRDGTSDTEATTFTDFKVYMDSTLLTEGTDYTITGLPTETGISGTFSGTISIKNDSVKPLNNYKVKIEVYSNAGDTPVTSTEISCVTQGNASLAPYFGTDESTTLGEPEVDTDGVLITETTQDSITANISFTIPSDVEGYNVTRINTHNVKMIRPDGGITGISNKVTWVGGLKPEFGSTSGTYTGTLFVDGLTSGDEYTIYQESDYQVMSPDGSKTVETVTSVMASTTTKPADPKLPVVDSFALSTDTDAVTSNSVKFDVSATLPNGDSHYVDTVDPTINGYINGSGTPVTAANFDSSSMTFDSATGKYTGSVIFKNLTANTSYDFAIGINSNAGTEVMSSSITQVTSLAPALEPTVSINDAKNIKDNSFSFVIDVELPNGDPNTIDTELSETPLKVYLGTTSGSLTEATEDTDWSIGWQLPNGDRTVWKVRINVYNLTPGTEYFYQVGIGTNAPAGETLSTEKSVTTTGIAPVKENEEKHTTEIVVGTTISSAALIAILLVIII